MEHLGFYYTPLSNPTQQGAEVAKRQDTLATHPHYNPLLSTEIVFTPKARMWP